MYPPPTARPPSFEWLLILPKRTDQIFLLQREAFCRADAMIGADGQAGERAGGGPRV